MKKVLLVLAAIALVTPAFGADVQLWFSEAPTAPGAPEIANYQSQAQTGTVTLYLWGQNLTVEDNVSSIGLDLDFEGDIINPDFTLNNTVLGSDVFGNPFPAWDVTAGDNTDDLRWGAVQTPGLPTQDLPGVDSNPMNLGTLTFETAGGPSSIEMLVGPLSIGFLNPNTGEGAAASVLFGGGEAEISGDFVANEENELPQGDGVADAINPIPEPTTMILLGLGALGVIRRRRS